MKKRILIVDDDASIRNGLKKLLKKANYEVVLAADGFEAVDRFFSEPIDLLLLDLNMPRKDGREALAEIKQDPALKSIPIVILTTSTAEEDIVRTYCSGANSYISKPVTFHGLVGVMRTLGGYWFHIVQLPEE